MRRLIIPAIAAIIAFAILMGLGTWQMQRLAWKEALIAKIDARIVAEPVDINTALMRFNAGEDIEYTRITVAGTYDHAKELHVFQVGDAGPGWHIYTPLELESGATVIVNRGYVPLARKEAESRADSQPEGRVQIAGLLRGQSEKGLFGNDNDPMANEWYWRDVVGMAQAMGLDEPPIAQAEMPTVPFTYPFVIDAEAGGDPGDIPEDGTTIIELSNRHFGYALTWYGLGGTLVLVAGPFLWRRWRQA
ncbi:MAG: SURF1 family protein [Pseudomonadota bacterium]